MDFFRFFPKEYFTMPGNEQVSVLMPNIFKYVVIPDEVKNDVNVTLNWNNNLCLSPDEISIRLYDTPKYWWVVLFVNNIDNLYNKWPIDEDSLVEWLERKYHWTSPHTEIMYYMTANGLRTDLSAMKIMGGYPLSEADETIISLYSLTPVTVIDHFIMENDKKKDIVLIHPDYINYYDDVLTALKE